MPLAHLSCVQLVLSRILIFLINLHFFDRPGTLPIIFTKQRTFIGDFSNWRTPDSWYCCALRKLFETFLIPLGGKKRREEKENYRKSSTVLNRIKNLMSSRNWKKSLFCKNKYKYFLIFSVSVLNLMRCVVAVSDSQINLWLSSLNLNSPSLQICLDSRLENRSL